MHTQVDFISASLSVHTLNLWTYIYLRFTDKRRFLVRKWAHTLFRGANNQDCARTQSVQKVVSQL